MMARKTHGRVFKIGKRFYCEYYVNGQRFKKRLLDRDGKPVATAREAEVARERLVAPYTAKDLTDRREQAVEALRTAETAAVEAERLTAGEMPLANVWQAFPYDTNERRGGGEPERTLAKGSIEDNMRMWKSFTTWAEGRGVKRLSEVSVQTAADYRIYLQTKTMSPRRVNMHVMTARVMFRKAGIRPNPWEGLPQLAHRQGKRMDIPEAKLIELITAAEGDMRLLVMFGCLAGMRLGDACRVEWKNVSPDLSMLTFTPSKTSYKADAEIAMPLHPNIRDQLALTPPADRHGYILPGLASLYDRNKTCVCHQFEALLKTVGMEPHEPGTGSKTGRRAVVRYGFHSLRHSFVSVAARRHVPLSTVQALCGHSSDVQRRYLHANNEDRQKAIGAMPSLTNGDVDCADRDHLLEAVKTMPIDLVRKAIAQYLQ